MSRLTGSDDSMSGIVVDLVVGLDSLVIEGKCCSTALKLFLAFMICQMGLIGYLCLVIPCTLSCVTVSRRHVELFTLMIGTCTNI